MSILVTGGAGYIGSHTAHMLCDASEDVVILDNFSTGFRNAIPQNAKLVEGNVLDDTAVLKLLSENHIDSIIHFAGSIVVPDSITDPLGYYLNNTVASRSLIDCAVKAGVKHFLFSSTAAVYGMPDVNPIGENAALKPISPYGTSKMMTEMMLEDCAKAYPLTFAALRYFNVAGADPEGRIGQSTPRATHLIKVACQTALGQRPGLQVFGTDYDTSDGTCIRDYIHVSDLAKAHVLALQHLRKGGASFISNCGYGRGFSVREVVDVVKQVSGVDFAVDYVGRRPGDPAALIAKSEKVRDLLGWKPAFDDLNQIVEDAFRWEKQLAA
jgi:UDP-glucose 4-epimerase